MKFKILLNLTFCAIHLSQDLTVLILVLLTLQLLKSIIRQNNRKLRDEFSLLVSVSVLKMETLYIQDAFVSVAAASVCGKISFDMLFFSNFRAPFTLPLLIKILNLIEIFSNSHTTIG